VAEVSVRYFNF